MSDSKNKDTGSKEESLRTNTIETRGTKKENEKTDKEEIRTGTVYEARGVGDLSDDKSEESEEKEF